MQETSSSCQIPINANMLNEGFYNNVNANTPFRVIGNILKREIETEANSQASIRKAIPNARASIDQNYVVTVASALDPNNSYSFDLKDQINKIYNFFISTLESEDVDVDHLNNDIWEDLLITSKNYNHYGGIILVDFRVIKGELILSISGNHYHVGLFTNSDTYDLLKRKKNNYYSYSSTDFLTAFFKEKLEIKATVESNYVSICMDLRTYLTKAIKGLHDGTLSQIQVKKSIEDYIKKL